MSNRPAITVLWIGDSRAEFAAAKVCLARISGVSIIERLELRSANAWLATQSVSPALIVVCQARPGEIAHTDIDQLLRVAPLSRLVGLLGTWCEGETRSGRPWPAVERVYWHQWPTWLARELNSHCDDVAPNRLLPLTATAEERWLAVNQTRAIDENRKSVGGLVAILSARRANTELLSDACQRYGLQAICFDQPPGHVGGASLGIWDSDRCGEPDALELRQFVAAVRPAPVVALLTFPRIEEWGRALAAGASQIISKPLDLAQLARTMPHLPED